MSRRSHWSQLRNLDKLLIVVLMPAWLVCLLLHVELAASGDLRTPAIILQSSANADDYPTVEEVLDGSEVTVEDAGLNIGDRLVAVNGVELGGKSGLIASTIAFAQLGEADKILVTAMRDGRQFEAEYPFAQFPIPWWWPTLFAVSFGLIGFFILISAPASRSARAVFPAFVTFALTWLYFPGHSQMQVLGGFVIYAISMLFAAPLIVRAMLLIPERSAIRHRSAYIAGWLFAVMALFATSTNVGVPFSAAVGQTGHLVSISAFYLVILAILARNYVCADKLGRRQLRWILLGFYLAFVPALVVSATIILFPDQFNLYTLSSIGMPIIPLMFLIAISRYNLFDIDRLIGGTLSYSIMAVLVAVIAETVVEPMVADTGTQFGFDGNTVQILFVAILTAVLIPAQRRWRPYIDRLFFPEGVAVGEAIEALIEQLGKRSEDDPLDWIRLVGDELAGVYKFDGWAAYRSMPDGPELAMTEGTAPPVLDNNSIWQKYERRLIPGTELLEDQSSYLVVPVRPTGSLQWLLVLGPKSSGDVYTTTDSGLVASVAHILAGEIADHTVTA